MRTEYAMQVLNVLSEMLEKENIPIPLVSCLYFMFIQWPMAILAFTLCEHLEELFLGLFSLYLTA